MSARNNKEIVRRMYDGLAEGDASAFWDAFYDDAEFLVIGNTIASGLFNGKREFIDNVVKPLGRLCATPLVLTPTNLIAENDSVVAELTGTATTKTGVRYDNVYCQVFLFANGKIRRLTEYMDTELVTEAFAAADLRRDS